MTLKFGLLGAGRIGKVHAGAVAASSGAKLVAVADALPEAAEAIARSSGAEVRSVDAIMKAKDVDAVLITTPTDLHADMIEQAARAGKAIFCEKPIDLSVERVRRCLDVVRARKGAADDRLQPPLRPELPGGARPHRRRRDRRGGDGVDHLARSRPAAGRLYRALGRPVPRHDDP